MKKYILIILLLPVSFLSFFSSKPYSAEKFRLWNIAWESNKDFISPKTTNIEKKYNNPQGILDYLFKKSEKFQPKIVLIKNGVAYVNLEGDSDLLTTRSGTTGAYHFAATVVFNLTEFENINSVYFVDEGEHFSRGESNRMDYWHLMPNSERLMHKEFIEQSLNAKNLRTAIYVEFLQDIGDSQSIHELNLLKEQLHKIGYYGGCSMTERDLEELIDTTIEKIKSKHKQ